MQKRTPNAILVTFPNLPDPLSFLKGGLTSSVDHSHKRYMVVNISVI